MNNVFARIYSAHNGAGAKYVVIDGDDASVDIKRSTEWSRRDLSALPGRPRNHDASGVVYVADAARVGLIDEGQEPFGLKFGPEGLEADAGGVGMVEINLDQLRT